MRREWHSRHVAKSGDKQGMLSTFAGSGSQARLVFWSRKDQVLTLTESGTMARQPNYDFERRERDRLKKLKNAERAEAKLKPAAETQSDAPDSTEGEA